MKSISGNEDLSPRNGIEPNTDKPEDLSDIIKRKQLQNHVLEKLVKQLEERMKKTESTE
ncbi:MAG: hypothetical protein KKA81_13935 [Bacteroidetes bacterium]|nr:hypothetical protein [Bacteroidota bacterium]